MLCKEKKNEGCRSEKGNKDSCGNKRTLQKLAK
jgi:hypothetical protein